MACTNYVRNVMLFSKSAQLLLKCELIRCAVWSLALKVNPETGWIDYDRLQENARLFHPKLIIAGHHRSPWTQTLGHALSKDKRSSVCLLYDTVLLPSQCVVSPVLWRQHLVVEAFKL